MMWVLLWGVLAVDCPLTAKGYPETFKRDYRILKLLPGLVKPLAIDPAVPDDFVVRAPKGKASLFQGVYWGRKEVLEEYFKDPESLKEPILRVKLSQHTLDHTNVKWGNHPVHEVKTIWEGKEIDVALVALNGDEGWTLMFSPVYPEGEGRPNEADMAFWNDFIANTRPLNEKEALRLRGQDLHEGYTLVDSAGAKMKVIAEKREDDGVIQVGVIPKNSKVDFKYLGMSDGIKGGTPFVKVHGQILQKKKNFKYAADFTTSVFVKSVKEFSFKKDENVPLVYRTRSDGAFIPGF